MALSYTGTATFTEASIRIYGDGESRTIAIDLSKPPFGLNFTSKLPTYAVIINPSDNPGVSMTVVGSKLNFIFDEPPPAVDPMNPTPGGRDLSIRFAYIADATKSKTRNRSKRRR